MARPFKNIMRVKVMRELEREANFRPLEGAARVFILEDADSMNDQAASALLKTLEEPAPSSHLILTTANPTGLLATIRSRCQTMRFGPLPAQAIEELLLRKHKLRWD